MELLILIEQIANDPEMIHHRELASIPGDMAEIILYLHTNYTQKITIAELTQLYHINRTSLAERFQQVVGVPIMTYLIELRIKIASSLLRDSLIPVTEVTERVGFKDIAHFNRMFRKYTSFSPTEYRQQHSWLMR